MSTQQMPSSEPGKKNTIKPPVIIAGILIIVAIIVAIVLLLPKPAAKVEKPVAVTEQKESTKPSDKVSPASETVAPGPAISLAELEAVIKANTPIYFEKDSTRYLAGEQAKIDNIAKALKGFKNIHLLFRGHTALFGSEKFRKALSLARSKKVRWAFENRVGYDITSVTIYGLGAKELVSKGDSEAKRAPNRRVEIILQNAEVK